MELSNLKNLNGSLMNPDAIALPCGLIAKYHFNDTFRLSPANEANKLIEIDEKGIALYSDTEHKFKTTPEKMNQTWLNLNDEHVMVWFQMESASKFIKLWGHVNGTLEAGREYNLLVENNWIDITQFEGRKYVYLSEVNNFGGKSRFIGLAFGFSAIAILIMMVIFILLYFVRIKDRNIYSTNDL
jgi:hypothetical protein